MPVLMSVLMHGMSVPHVVYPRTSLAHLAHLNEVGSSYRYRQFHRQSPLGYLNSQESQSSNRAETHQSNGERSFAYRSCNHPLNTTGPSRPRPGSAMRVCRRARMWSVRPVSARLEYVCAAQR